MTEKMTCVVSMAREPTEMVLGFLGFVPPPRDEHRAELVHRISMDAAEDEISFVSDQLVGEGLLVDFPNTDPIVIRKMQGYACEALHALGYTAIPEIRVRTLEPGQSLLGPTSPDNN